MANTRLVWKPDALYNVRRSGGVIAAVAGKAEEIAAKANEMGKGTYLASSRQGARAPQGRWRATVVTADWMSMRNNMKYNTLLKAMGVSGGGGASPAPSNMVTYTRRDGTTRQATRAQAENWGRRRRV